MTKEITVNQAIVLTEEEKERMKRFLTEIRPGWWAGYASREELQGLATGCTTLDQVQVRALSKMQEVTWLLGHARLMMELQRESAIGAKGGQDAR